MGVEQSGTVAVLAEKPSVARDIAKVLGANSKGEGYMHGNGYVVTWAIGHLAALAQPHEINPLWKSWRRHLLPMLPEQWPLVVYEKTQGQFNTVKQILTSPKVGRVVCATDAGREGELIFRYIYEAAHCTKPVSRLWISSLTPEAIRAGFDGLRPAAGIPGRRGEEALGLPSREIGHESRGDREIGARRCQERCRRIPGTNGRAIRGRDQSGTHERLLTGFRQPGLPPRFAARTRRGRGLRTAQPRTVLRRGSRRR